MARKPDRLTPVRANSRHDPVKFGLSRYCDEYKLLPYGERVRLETSLSIAEVKVLDVIEKHGKQSLKDLEKRVNREFNLQKLLDAKLVFKDESKKYDMTNKGCEIWEAIVVYHGGK